MAEESSKKKLEYNNIALEKIFENVANDLGTSPSQYSQFRVPTQQNQGCAWMNYIQNQHFISSSLQPNHSNLHPINSVSSESLSSQELPGFDSRNDFFSPQRLSHLGINENNDLINNTNVGGNFIESMYNNDNKILGENQSSNNLSSVSDKILPDQKYGLFNKQTTEMHQSFMGTSNITGNSKQLIDNLVGNWVPNQSGTYSPFGGSPNVTPVPQLICEPKEREELFSNESIKKKHRIVAEVKPMRPTYSDVLTKSASTSLFPLNATINKPKQETNAFKKVVNKNSKNKSKLVELKRQNSCGSDDHGSPKIQHEVKSTESSEPGLSRRWVSLDNLDPKNNIADTNNDDSKKSSTTNAPKKKNSKSIKKSEKSETLNNSKVQNSNEKNNTNIQKKPIQINNNLNTNNNYNQTSSTNKGDKNQQINTTKVKEEKKSTKDRSSKHSQQNDKLQQIRKGQRSRKRDRKEINFEDVYKTFLKYSNHWYKFTLKVFFWFLHLLSDVLCMSANLMIQLGTCMWFYMLIYLKYSWDYFITVSAKIKFLKAAGNRIDDWFGNSRLAFWRRLKKTNTEEKQENLSWIPGSLEKNIILPTTGEEAMKRLLACKGKDPYSILGVTPNCTDDDIKKYYKRQAFLVHPDKNNQPGAEEAFKILVHAFDIIGVPERRQAFDQTRQVEAAWGELSDLLLQLHKKMEQAANTIRCTNCGSRHKRVPTDRPCYAARYCAQCKIRHSAKEGDIWAESQVMGFLWHYYACMEGGVYDVTEWAACQAANLKHLKANTHIVQYRIVLGQRFPPRNGNSSKSRQSDSNAQNKAEFEDFLNNLYNKKGGTSSSHDDQPGMKGDNRKRKSKRKNK